MAKMFKIFLPLQTGEQYLNIEFTNGKSLKFVVSLPRVSNDTSFGFFNHVIVIWRSFNC